MANADVRLGHKDTAFFNANPALVLEDGQCMFISDGANQGQYKIGDGVTALSALTFYGGVSSSGLDVGTTAIANGTNGYILYNNNGVLGNLATTGSGDVVLATSPAFVTGLTTPKITGVTNALTIDALTTVLDTINFGASGVNGQLSWGGGSFKFLGGSTTPDVIIGTPTHNSGRFKLNEATGTILIGTLSSMIDNTVDSLQIDTSMASPIINVKATNISTTPEINLIPYSANKSIINFRNQANTATRAFLDLNEASGEFRIVGNSGGYYPTFYSNGVQRMIIDTSGNVNIGNATTTSQRLVRIGQDTAFVDIGSLVGTTSSWAIYGNTITPSAFNYSLSGTSVVTNINGGSAVNIQVGTANSIAINSFGESTFASINRVSLAGTAFTFASPTNTNQTLGTNIPNFKVTGSNKQWATGALATQYFNYFSANTLSFVGASTATNVYGLYVEAATAGTNATITNNYAAGFLGRTRVEENNGSVTLGSIASGYSTIWLGQSSPSAANYNILMTGSTALTLQASSSVTLSANLGTYYVNITSGGKSHFSNGTKTMFASNSDATAWVEIAAGTATAGTAPLKLTPGTNLTTPENGAFEFDGTNLYFTVGGVRKTVTLV